MKFPFKLLILELTRLRTGMCYSDKHNQKTYCEGLVAGFLHGSSAPYEQRQRLFLLLDNCSEYFEKPFPCAENAGPQLPNWRK